MSVIFKRKLYNRMLAWKNERKGSTALLVKGARRVGKSTLVEQFAEQQYWAHDAQGLGRQCPSGGEAQGLGSSYTLKEDKEMPTLGTVSNHGWA